MKKRNKLIVVCVTVATLLASIGISTYAYGGTEHRTDNTSNMTNTRINVPNVNVGTESYSYFLDNAQAWHNDRDYYGNGAVSVTNYRDNPDTTYTLPYLYNYYYRSSSASYDKLRYTLPSPHSSFRVTYDKYFLYFDDLNVLELTTSASEDVPVTYRVSYNYSVPHYDAENNVVRYDRAVTEVVDYVSSGGSVSIPMTPPHAITNGYEAIYDLRVTTWNVAFDTITIGTVFDTYETLKVLEQEELERLIGEYKTSYTPVPVLENLWRSLYGAVDDFFAIEFFPGFNLGTIVFISLGLAVLGLVLKFFAGG